MKLQFKNDNKNKKDNFSNSKLIYQNINFKFITEEKDKINRISIINKINKIIFLNNKNNQIENKKYIIYNTIGEYIFHKIIINFKHF